MPQSDTQNIRQVTERDLKRYAEDLGLSLSPAEVEDYKELVNGTLDLFEDIADSPKPRFPHQEITYSDRQTGWRPSPDEDSINAWTYRCEIEGADEGILSGIDIGLKDNIALAGYPMTAGSKVLSEFTPRIDATVARRLLEAGGTIVGKQNMESFAFSGTGDMSDFGPVLNPYSDEHLAGGSSGGGAAAVAVGDCDVSIGSDQAGSVRIPSSCCGTVGLKPTRGLVPYTGAIPLDLSVDHLGPIAENVELVAKTLEAIAGEDAVDGLRLDPRQPRGVKADDYTANLQKGISGLDIGIVEEGFNWDFAESEITAAVRDAIGVFDEEGATTASVSIEQHQLLSSAAGVVATISGARTLENAGVTRGTEGWYWTEFANALDAFLDARTDQLPPAVKQSLLTAAHVMETRSISLYAAAKNLALDAEKKYNQLLEEFDALVMPTLVVPPMERDADLGRVEMTSREWTLAANTAAMNLMGHPAITVPCAKVDGLPVGMMVVGGHFDEATIIQIAAGFESVTEWESL